MANNIPSDAEINELVKAAERGDIPVAGEEVTIEEPDYTRIEPQRKEAMFPGILGDVVKATTTNTEAVPVAVAINFLCRLSAMIGRPSKAQPLAPFLYVGDNVIHCRPFAIICGNSGKGRKGTSDKPVARIFDTVNSLAGSCTQGYNPLRLNTHSGGLSSGEGISYCLRDGVGQPEDKDYDAGQPDKRLFVVEEEFSNVLTQCRRESNTLSSVIRCVFDGGTLAPLTKKNQTTATEPHISIVGHITSYELVEKTTGNDVSNGFLNRFMIAFTKREKIVPFPERTPDDVIKGFAERVIDIVRFSHTAGRISLTSDAKVTWGEIYHDLTTWEGGRVITSLFARSEMYCLMLAMLFALMDKRKEIDTPDLAAAYAWLEYWKHTLIYVFDGERMKVEADHKADFAEEVYQAIASLNGGQGCTQTEIYNHFGRNKSSAELAAALEHLMTRTPPRASVQSIRPNPKAKRPTKIYTAT